MVPLTRYSNVAGVPLNEMLPADKLTAIVDRTRKGGGEIVALLKQGSAFYAPSAAIAQMAESIIKNKNLILPCSIYLQGEYGLKDIFFGVPAQLGNKGLVKVIEYKLNADEKAMVEKSAVEVKESITALKM
jgi:malate dehydrogenase